MARNRVRAFNLSDMIGNKQTSILKKRTVQALHLRRLEEHGLIIIPGVPKKDEITYDHHEQKRS